ncbi:MAG: anti-sigma factor [Gemmatimonadaceae bacterium]
MSDDEMKNDRSGPHDSSKSNDDVVLNPADQTPYDDADPRFDVAGAALGALDRTEEADVFTAAAADSVISSELAAMENVAAELARLAPVKPMNRGRSAGIRSRLVARAAATRLERPAPRASAAPGDADRPVSTPLQRGISARRTPLSNPHTVSAAAPTPSRPSAPKRTLSHYVPFEPASRASFRRVAGMVAIAAVLVIAAIGVRNWTSRSSLGRGSDSAAASRDSILELRVASLQASLAQKDSLIGALTGMRTRVIDLVGYKSVDPMARMFWDQKSQMFIMYASHLKQPAAGKTYQVWLIARGVAAPISAGTFMPDSSGAAVMAAKYAMEPGTLRRIAVTEEPMGGMPSPTGAVVFTGQGK